MVAKAQKAQKTPQSPKAARKGKPGPKPNGGVSKASKTANAGSELSRDAIFMYRVYLNGVCCFSSSISY